MQHTKKLLLSLGTALVLAACGNSNGPEKKNNNQNQQGPSDPTTGACGLSQTICANGTVCCNGTCVDITSSSKNCGKCGVVCDEACIDSQCKPYECQNGEFKCNGQELQLCTNHTFGHRAECTKYQICNAEKGSCDPRSDLCEERSTKCVDNKYMICSDGDYKEQDICEVTETCDDTKGCVSNVTFCQKDEKRCYNNNVEICAADLSKFDIADECGLDQMCDKDSKTCVPIQCHDGDKECRTGNKVVECQSNNFNDKETCSGDKPICNAGECVAKVCDEDEYSCDTDNKLYRCINNSLVLQDTCNTTQYCNATEKKCAPKCGNNQLDDGETCDASATINPNNGKTCATEVPGHSEAEGILSCNATCDGFIIKDCTYCGDNERNGSEICDTNTAVPECKEATSNEWSTGTVTCQDNCKGWNIQNCSLPDCGGDEEFRCNGNTFEMCYDGHWESDDKPCQAPNQFCEVNAASVCVPKPGTCDPEKEPFMCYQNSLLECGDDHYWALLEECGSDRPYCDTEYGCNTSAPNCTQFGALRCNGSNVERCDDTHHWIVEKTCSYGNTTCIEDNGEAECYLNSTPCTNDGEKKCFGDSIAYCVSGHWMFSYSCSVTNKPFCNPVSNECAQYNSCEEGKIDCYRNRLRMCSEEQGWVEMQNCNETGQTCDADQATCTGESSACDPAKDNFKCSGTTIMMCNSGNNKWTAVESCSNDKNGNNICDANSGSCISDCTNGADKCSADNRYLGCDNGKWIELDNCSSAAHQADLHTICDASAATPGCTTGKTCAYEYTCNEGINYKCIDGIDSAQYSCIDNESQKTECQPSSTPCTTPSIYAKWCTFVSISNNNAYIQLNPDNHPAADFEVRVACGAGKHVRSWNLISNATQNMGFDYETNKPNIEFQASMPAGVTSDMHCAAEIRNAGANSWYYCSPNGFGKSNPPILIHNWTYIGDGNPESNFLKP